MENFRQPKPCIMKNYIKKLNLRPLVDNSCEFETGKMKTIITKGV